MLVLPSCCQDGQVGLLVPYQDPNDGILKALSGLKACAGMGATHCGAQCSRDLLRDCTYQPSTSSSLISSVILIRTGLKLQLQSR